VTYFADTWFWVALLNKKDPDHNRAHDLNRKIGASPIVTSQLVMVEFFGFCCGLGKDLRLACCKLVKTLKTDPHVTVVPYSDQQYDRAVQLYEQVSNDKRWSLVDCASFLIMEEAGIQIAVTSDHHFEQRGYTLLE
jgi:predicted nucleic acid-binding protein